MIATNCFLDRKDNVSVFSIYKIKQTSYGMLVAMETLKKACYRNNNFTMCISLLGTVAIFGMFSLKL